MAYFNARKAALSKDQFHPISPTTRRQQLREFRWLRFGLIDSILRELGDSGDRVLPIIFAVIGHDGRFSPLSSNNSYLASLLR